MIASKKGRFKKIQETYREWSLSSTAQCLPKVFQYENIYAKCIWAIIFLAFAIATGYFFIQGVFDYLEFDIISKIRVFSEKTLVYPVVTLCNSNPITTKQGEAIFKDFKSEMIKF
jgi:hypothetical protein